LYSTFISPICSIVGYAVNIAIDLRLIPLVFKDRFFSVAAFGADDLPETYKDGADYTVISTPVNRLEREVSKIFGKFLVSRYFFMAKRQSKIPEYCLPRACANCSNWNQVGILTFNLRLPFIARFNGSP
jgi:hypothetical protein